ncbi:unnamed protein product [Adineta steineri]|uniref:Uncharacterized protein n=1 Tax=Adineta steineri TaxID=433720 RepID=A0A814SFY5_9BILA|nr:unnamed protein product [Adineta steineri]CAF1317892.1 unnamed protein product [Adineta steineri]
MISAQQTTVMVIPLKVGLVVEYLDRSSYWIRLIFIQLFLNLTNSILFKSFLCFPLGWIVGTIIPLIIDNFWWTITNKYPRILGKPMTDEDKYRYLYENIAVVTTALITSIISFFIAIGIMVVMVYYK